VRTHYTVNTPTFNATNRPVQLNNYACMHFNHSILNKFVNITYFTNKVNKFDAVTTLQKKSTQQKYNLRQAYDESGPTR